MSNRPPPPSQPQRFSWIDALDPMQSLRVRAAILFGVMPVLFTIAFARLVERSMRTQIEDQFGPNLAILANQVADKLDRAYWERFNELQVAATLQPIRFGTVEERRRLLSTIATASPNYVWLAFIDTKGEVIAASRGLEEGINVAESAFFVGGMTGPYGSSLHGPDNLGAEAAAVANPKYLDMATPVWGNGNAPVGVIAGRLDWSIAKEVQNSVVPDTTRKARLNVTIYAQNREVLLDSGGSGWEVALDAPTLPDEARIRGAMWEQGPDGSFFLTGYSHTTGYRDFRKLYLLTTVRQQADDLLLPARELHDRIMATGFGLAALSALGGWFVGWRISRRMIQITRSARRIQEGDVLTVIPQFRGNDETARLAAAVGDMAEELRARKTEPDAPAGFGRGANR